MTARSQNGMVLRMIIINTSIRIHNLTRWRDWPVPVDLVRILLGNCLSISYWQVINNLLDLSTSYRHPNKLSTITVPGGIMPLSGVTITLPGGIVSGASGTFTSSGVTFTCSTGMVTCSTGTFTLGDVTTKIGLFHGVPRGFRRLVGQNHSI